MRLLLIIAVIWGYLWAKRNGRLPKGLGPKPFHVSARNSAIFGIALTVLIYFVALFYGGDDARLGKSLQTMLPVALLFLAAFGFVVYRLRRGPDNAGLAMAIAFPAAILFMGMYGIHDTWVHGDSDAQKGVFFSIMFAFAIPPLGLFLYVMVPTMLRMMYKSIRAIIALHPGTRPNLAAVAGFALMSAVGYNSAWSTAHKVDARGLSENYRVDKMEETLDPLYLCLWRFGSDDSAGLTFPDSIGATRILEGGEHTPNCARVLTLLPERPYTLQYERPSPHTFRITLTEKTWRNKPVHKAWVDQTGVMRTAVTIDGKLDSVRVENASPLVHLLMVQRKIDEYAAKDPHHEYPRQLLRAHYLSDTLPPGSLPLQTFKDCYGWDSKEGSCVETSRGRRMIYVAGRDSTGKPAYVLALLNDVSMQSQAEHESLDTDVGQRFRSYLRDETGALHAYGGTRDASMSDPPPLPDELAAAQERLESWWKTLRSSEVYDSIGHARWDSTLKFRADSARRDSVKRGLLNVR